MKLTRPIKPFKTLKELAQIFAYPYNEDKFNKKFDLKNNFPCYECSGRGYLHEWTGIGSDYNDSDCLFCNCTGTINKTIFVENIAIPKMKKYKKDLEEYRILNKKVAQILNKVTKEEINIIKAYL